MGCETDLDIDIAMLAGIAAAIILEENGLCLCVDQGEIVMRRLLPLVRHVRFELSCRCEGCIQDAAEYLEQAIARHYSRLTAGCHLKSFHGG